MLMWRCHSPSHTKGLVFKASATPATSAASAQATRKQTGTPRLAWPVTRTLRHPGLSPSRFRDDVYELVRTMPWYRQDLDCVVEAPDGSVAAYTLAWLDEQNRVGELEPVGTHADHRRLGLGRAVNVFAMRRLREEGATTALVGCRGDAAYPIPCKLYESVGFRAVGRTISYRRA